MSIEARFRIVLVDKHSQPEDIQTVFTYEVEGIHLNPGAGIDGPTVTIDVIPRRLEGLIEFLQQSVAWVKKHHPELFEL